MRRLLLVSLVAIVLLSPIALRAQRDGAPPPPPPPRDRIDRLPPMMPGMPPMHSLPAPSLLSAMQVFHSGSVGLLVERLKLTQDQQRSVIRILDKNTESSGPIVARQRALAAGFVDKLLSADPDPVAIAAAAAETMKVEQEIFAKRVATISEIRALLTTEQSAEFNKLLGQMLVPWRPPQPPPAPPAPPMPPGETRQAPDKAAQ